MSHSLDISVRRACANDFDVIANLASIFRKRPSRFGCGVKCTVESPLAGSPQMANELLLVAQNSSGLVGYLSAHAYKRAFSDERVVWVDELFVLSELRRNRTGTQLMAHCRDWAVELGASSVCLASAGAQDFYLAVGYKATAAHFKMKL